MKKHSFLSLLFSDYLEYIISAGLFILILVFAPVVGLFESHFLLTPEDLSSNNVWPFWSFCFVIGLFTESVILYISYRLYETRVISLAFYRAISTKKISKMPFDSNDLIDLGITNMIDFEVYAYDTLVFKKKVPYRAYDWRRTSWDAVLESYMCAIKTFHPTGMDLKNEYACKNFAIKRVCSLRRHACSEQNDAKSWEKKVKDLYKKREKKQ